MYSFLVQAFPVVCFNYMEYIHISSIQQFFFFLIFVMQVHILMLQNCLVLLWGMAWCFLLFLSLSCSPLRTPSLLLFFKAVKKVWDLLSFNVKGLKIFSHIQQVNIHVKYRKLIFLIKCDINRKKKTYRIKNELFKTFLTWFHKLTTACAW